MSTTKHFVRVLAGGCILGSMAEDGFGKPLTLQGARKIAAFENERSSRRRAQKLSDCFDYVVDSVNMEDFRRRCALAGS